MSDLDLDALEAVAQAATPGPWQVLDSIHGDPVVHQVDRAILSGGGVATAFHGEDYGRADAVHIAAFDPPTVLALIAELRDSRARIARQARVLARLQEAADPILAARILAAAPAAPAEAECTCESDDPSFAETHATTCPQYLALRREHLRRLQGQALLPDLQARQEPGLPPPPSSRKGRSMSTESELRDTISALAEVIEQVRALLSGPAQNVSKHALRAALAAAPTPPAEAECDQRRNR